MAMEFANDTARALGAAESQSELKSAGVSEKSELIGPKRFVTKSKLSPNISPEFWNNFAEAYVDITEDEPVWVTNKGYASTSRKYNKKHLDKSEAIVARAMELVNADK